MDLTTRCPKCHTVFQASLSDLQLRKGYIRCVQCANIFDGYAEVVSESQTINAETGVINPQEPVINTADIDVVSTTTEPDFIVSSSDEISTRHSISDAESLDNQDDGFSISDLETEVKPAQADSFIVEPDPYRRGLGTAADLIEPRSTLWLIILGWLLTIALILLLVLQGVYVYRLQIAQNFPTTRPLLEKYCVLLACEVPYTRDLDNLVITKSALKIIKQEVSEPNQETEDATADKVKKYELQFNLRNLSALDQQWPTVVLNLKDSSGQIQVRRNLSPQDYVPGANNPLPAQQEIFVRLPLELRGDININGFQLDLFFP